MRQSGAGRGLHLLLRNVRLPVGNVVAHGVVEQHRLLRDHADLRAQRGQRDVAHVAAIDEQASGGDIEEARNQMHQRALACAARSDDGHHFSGAHFEIDVAQNFARLVAVRFVGEAHILEANALAKGRQRLRARLLPDVVFGIHELENLRRRAQRLLEIVVEQGKLAHRIVELEHRDDESAEMFPAVKTWCLICVAAQQQKQGDGDRAEDVHQRRTDRRRRHRAQVGREQPLRRLGESARSPRTPC